MASKPGEPRIKLAEPLRAERVEAPYPFRPDLYEARFMKDAQVPRNTRLVNAHSGNNVVHRLLASLEGFGFCKEGEGGAFVQNGRIEIGGELPCNTSGGMLSESYMQSWNHQPELVRQLRGGLGNRQVQGAEVAQYVHDVAGKCKSLIYTRGA